MSRYSINHQYASPSPQYYYPAALDSSSTYASLGYSPESMYRYGSSEGSSYTYSAPTSPGMDYQGYTYQDESQYYEQYPAGSSMASTSGYQDMATPDYSTLGTVEEEGKHGESSHKNRDSPVMCLYPGCDKIFKRRADLDRHYKHRHCSDTSKESYRCDYPKCVRRREPFGRRDHYRDHLRDFHKEDIEKRGVTVNKEWMEGRNVSVNWWRCHKCLARVYVNESQYECPSCKTTCQPERVKRRH